MTVRKATLVRRTKETNITVEVVLEGQGVTHVATGIGFLDHMLDALSRHSGIDVTLSCEGDLEVDDHHTAEDCALSLGQALRRAWGERRGINRFGSAYAPLDEALARAVVDLSGRPCAVIDLGLQRERLGQLSAENVEHFFVSLAMSMRAALHLDVLRGDNDHHRAEAAVKALALALKQAVAGDGSDRVPSTKGTLQ
jgi:imidazoleglycerol phosphate dehydratase HisB